MSKKKLSKLLALYLPYVVIGLLATNLGEAWRLAVGKELGDKIVSLMDTLPAAFANPLPSLHPFDLFIGLCCGTGMRLAVYLKGKNAKKYRHGMEYGSARWPAAAISWTSCSTPILRTTTKTCIMGRSWAASSRTAGQTGSSCGCAS